MAIGRLLLVLLAFALLANCDKKDPRSPDPGDPSGEIQVTGRERIGWSQQAADAVELALFEYVIYVDGSTRTPLTGVSCSSIASATGFDCSAALPALTPGPHTLELASVIMDPAGGVESPRSAPLRVVMTGTSSSSTSVSVRTFEGVTLVLEYVAGRLRDPVDITSSPDGAMFVAERAGTMRVVRNEVVAAEPALDISADVVLPEGGLLGIALDPRFAQTGFLYALYAAGAARDGIEIILARFRGVRDRFGERAILAARASRTLAQGFSPARAATGALRVGIDEKLYVAVDGEVLRLNSDATTPDDHAPPTPVYSLDHPAPRALDWHPRSRDLWVVDAVAPSGGRLTRTVPAFIEPRRAAPRTAYTLPQGTGPASATFYRGAAIPIFQGDLFIAADEGHELMRLRFDSNDASRIASVEPLFKDEIGPVRVVVEGRDGALYVASDSALYRLRQAPASGLHPSGQ